MSEENDNKNGVTIGFSSLLGLIFIILKLCHVIDWSWIWVLAPFWIEIALIILLIIIAAILF